MAITTKLRKLRSQERGAALFLVVLVISMVTAVGVFSMRAASLSNVAAGYSRQSMQASMLARLAAVGAGAYLDKYPGIVPPKVAITGCATDYVSSNPAGEAFCTILKGTRMENEYFPVDDGFVGKLSVSDGTAAGVSGNVIVEISGASAGEIAAGESLSGSDDKGPRSINVTITSRAQVYPFDPTTSGVCTAGAQEAIAEQRVRRHIDVPFTG